jgi:hypothetical protein
MAIIDFKSLDEIISRFNLDAKDAEVVKKQLKNLIKKFHPDTNGENGNFSTENDKNIFLEIKSAIEFLDGNQSTTTLATKNDITSLTKVLNELALSNKEEIVNKNIESKKSSLTTKLNESVIAYHKDHSSPKITSLVVASILTALWAFPNVVKDHPVSSPTLHPPQFECFLLLPDYYNLPS